MYYTRYVKGKDWPTANPADHLIPKKEGVSLTVNIFFVAGRLDPYRQANDSYDSQARYIEGPEV